MDDSDLNPKTRGLGRGLNALFEDDEDSFAQAAVDPSGGKPHGGRMMVAIELLEPGSLQPRQSFDDESLDQLAESIRAHGLLQPLLVRADKLNDERYEIIAGERRWRAAQRAQLHEVPVVLLELSDVEALEIALIENLQREDLNPIDEARGYQKLLQDYGHTQEKLARALGKSRPHIANMVRLLQLPSKVRAYVEEGKLSAGHARALITAENAEALAERIIREGLSVRQTERAASGAVDGNTDASPSAGKKSSGGKKSQAKDVDTLALEEEVSSVLGMRVTIDSKSAQAGTLKIEYKSLDQLDELLHKLSHFPGSRLTG